MPHPLITPDPYQFSLSSFIEIAPLMTGGALEDRTPLRMAQDETLAKTLQKASDITFTPSDLGQKFFFGCVDFLAYDSPEGQRKFLPLEFNGTGTGGMTNMVPFAFQELSETLGQLNPFLPKLSKHNPFPVILMPYYHPSRLLYEKILLGQAVKKGFQTLFFGKGKLVPLDHVLSASEKECQKLLSEPLVVLGSLKQMIQTIEYHPNVSTGTLTLGPHIPLSGSFHDVFLQNLFQNLEDQTTPQGLQESFLPINQLFPLCSDKGQAYAMMNDYLNQVPYQSIAPSIGFEYAHTEEELEKIVVRRVQNNHPTVIKPSGGGIGTGIEFFLTPEPLSKIREKIHTAMAATEKTYGAKGGGFPYTVCDFIDSAVIQDQQHPLLGHKYELRILVYRYGNTIKAIPAHVKVSGMKYDPAVNDKNMLMNNHIPGQSHDISHLFRLPLCNQGSLDTFHLTLAQMEEICHFTTGFIHHAIQHYQPLPNQTPTPL
jgi:hypothetical protein